MTFEELQRVNAILKKENAILTRALKWYANQENWCDDDWGVLAVLQGSGYGKPHLKAANALERARKVTE